MENHINDKYMRRALQLARGGEGRVAPNPMVGAVVVADGKIIGEGFHATYGGPHAEVNAIASVKKSDRHLLAKSTIYVTLEPCSHYGKTPPCAKLIIETGIPKVVTGAPDPNPLVSGRGIKMLREAGIAVTEGCLLKECLDINVRFMTAQTYNRPWVQLKWAQSSDGFMAGIDSKGNYQPIKFSSPLSSVWMHRERAAAQAIMVGSNTLAIDKPRLDVRLWAGKNPLKVECPHNADLPALLESLKQKGINSLMVEGGAKLLRSFISLGLYDEIRIEESPLSLSCGLAAPSVPPHMTLKDRTICRNNIISVFRR
ncbi:MAG: bifunctional diaminohydroxyphosphoribosylaminopyrimidine deaminase/5-amino-6-(5-phosphoribosylamino)uracil reductase RibD [Bacteroides sp.]|nr:bifunctional diaminohydroxyphosphoribosylaminopyrimidine deaminase/5-amino-6-(5-phosphoribosylamino)uracil reductase RibD [Bacteroides sp.]